MRSPCFECICVPICRYKGYIRLINECTLIWYYVGYATIVYNEAYKQAHIKPEVRAEIIETIDILKTEEWTYLIKGER
ncbi:MAG: hypothetical protein ACTSW1_07670 [Candidatus Hodarchaeales archaeon]